MEIRATITILVFSLLSIIFTYHVRLPYIALSFIIEGAQKGLMAMIIPSFLFRKISFFSRNFNIFSQDESFMKSVLSCWLIGLYLGGFYGVTASMIHNAWDLPPMKFWLLTSHCLSSFCSAAVIIFADGAFYARDLFTIVFSTPNTKISIKELILAMICSVIVADYITTIGILYIGCFLIMYYCIYLFIMAYPYLSGYGLGGFFALNCLINTFRIFYFRQKLSQRKAEEELKEVVPL